MGPFDDTKELEPVAKSYQVLGCGVVSQVLWLGQQISGLSGRAAILPVGKPG